MSGYASNEYTAISTIGHADYAKAGEDIVCAAVSVLVINTINSIETLTEDNNSMEIVQNQEEGLIHCNFTKNLSKESILLVDAMILGLKQIQEQYSKKYLRLIFEEV